MSGRPDDGGEEVATGLHRSQTDELVPDDDGRGGYWPPPFSSDGTKPTHRIIPPQAGAHEYTLLSVTLVVCTQSIISN